ncbi:MAG: IclR family transcriptional regulator [Pseudomonadota bacterium]
MSEQRVAAVDRALKILDCFDGAQDRLSLKALSEKTGLYKSTILRLSGSLEAFGYLSRSEDGTFSLGPTLWRLGSLYRRRFDFAERVRPVLRALSEETAETASFYVRDGDRRVCLFRHNGPQTIRHHLDEGVHFPLDQGAAGHVIRAHTEPSDETSAPVRQTGHATSLGERDPDTASIAVPVFGADKRFVGALVVSGLRSRLDEVARDKATEIAKGYAERLGPSLIAG